MPLEVCRCLLPVWSYDHLNVKIVATLRPPSGRFWEMVFLIFCSRQGVGPPTIPSIFSAISRTVFEKIDIKVGEKLRLSDFVFFAHSRFPVNSKVVRLDESCLLQYYRYEKVSYWV